MNLKARLDHHCNERVDRDNHRKRAFDAAAMAVVHPGDFPGQRATLRAYQAQMEGDMADNLQNSVEELLLAYESKTDIATAKAGLLAAFEATRYHSVLRSDSDMRYAVDAVEKAIARFYPNKSHARQ